MNDFIVTEVTLDEKRYLAAASYEDNVLSELQLEPLNENAQSIVGNIYHGYVDSIAKNIGGAFIRISKNELFFLPLHKQDTITASRPILVQVTKDAAGRKVPVVTRNIELSGKYAVVSRNPGRISFSKKLSDEQKRILKKWIPHEYGSEFHILIRTNAQSATKAALLEELDALMERMRRILKADETAKTGDLIDAPDPFYLNMVRDLYQAPDRTFSEIPLAAEQLAPFAVNQGSVPTQKEKAGLGLPELYHLNRDLARLTSKTVFLKSGAFLVIEQTDAFLSIDVITGKCQKGRIPEETYRKINLEAAAEIARQMRLRNLSGMILVDFINMTNPDHNEELLNVMKKLVRRDHIHTEAVDLTKLGIMEIIRQKSRKPLAFVLNA